MVTGVRWWSLNIHRFITNVFFEVSMKKFLIFVFAILVVFSGSVAPGFTAESEEKVSGI